MNTFQHSNKPPEQWLTQRFGDAWEDFSKIDPVAIIYGGRPRLWVTEHNCAHRLLKDLYRLGKKGTPIRGMICSRGALDRRSIHALNCWVQHCWCARSWDIRRVDGLHKYKWREIADVVGLRWIN